MTDAPKAVAEMPALKPCPFCGGEAELWQAHPGRKAWVACMGRCAVLVTAEHQTNEEAIATWNNRALSADDAEMVERVARAICQSGKFETGEGVCAMICMDGLGDIRKKGCGHCARVHGNLARAALSAMRGEP